MKSPDMIPSRIEARGQVLLVLAGLLLWLPFAQSVTAAGTTSCTSLTGRCASATSLLEALH